MKFNNKKTNNSKQADVKLILHILQKRMSQKIFNKTYLLIFKKIIKEIAAT